MVMRVFSIKKLHKHFLVLNKNLLTDNKMGTHLHNSHTKLVLYRAIY